MAKRTWQQIGILGLTLGLTLPGSARLGETVKPSDKEAWIAHDTAQFYFLGESSFSGLSCRVTSQALTTLVADLKEQHTPKGPLFRVEEDLADFRLAYERQGDLLRLHKPILKVQLRNVTRTKRPSQVKEAITGLIAQFDKDVLRVHEQLKMLFDAHSLSRLADRQQVRFTPSGADYVAQYTDRGTRRTVKTTFEGGVLVEEQAGERGLTRTRTTFTAHPGKGLVVNGIERHIQAAVPKVVSLKVKHQTRRGVLIPQEIYGQTRTAMGHSQGLVEERITLSDCRITP